MDIIAQLLKRDYNWDYREFVETHGVHDNVKYVIAEIQRIQHERLFPELPMNEVLDLIATSLYVNEDIVLQYIEQFKHCSQALIEAIRRIDWRFSYEHFRHIPDAWVGLCEVIPDIVILEKNIIRWQITIYKNPYITMDFIEKYRTLLCGDLSDMRCLTMEYVMEHPEIQWNYHALYKRFGYFDAAYVEEHMDSLANHIDISRKIPLYWRVLLDNPMIPYEIFIKYMDNLGEIYAFIRGHRRDIGYRVALYMDSINHVEAPYVCGEYAPIEIAEKYLHVCGAWIIEQNKHLTEEFILAHPEIKWNYGVLHKVMSLEYIDKHPEIKWNYYDIARHCILTEKFIDKYNLNLALVAENPNITLYMIDRYLQEHANILSRNPMTREKMLRKLMIV
jgi:hypothetical protein